MSVSISWIVALGSFSSVKSPNMRSISCCHFGISGKGRQGTWFFLCLTVSSVSLVIVFMSCHFLFEGLDQAMGTRPRHRKVFTVAFCEYRFDR